MTAAGPPLPRRWASGGMVCAVDHLAASAGVELLRAGGSAADAAVGASAVLAVTSQHLCGMGGDLLAVVAPPAGRPVALEAAGRAGSGADPERLRSEGHVDMPFRDDIRSVTVPGCVDGWLALHARFGRLPLAAVLEAAIGYAEDGFPASPTLSAAVPRILAAPGAEDYRRAAGEAPTVPPGATVRRPGVARALRAVVDAGREGFYGGEFGEGLLEVGGGEFAPADLAHPLDRWAPAVESEAWGARMFTSPPVSQGYLTLASAWMASRCELPGEPAAAGWAHLLVEASRQAGADRLEVLHEGAAGQALVDPEALAARLAAISASAAAGAPARPGEAYRAGDTTAVCAVDAERMGVSLIQSNAAGFGSHLAVPGVNIFLHNRGTGFRLQPGSPACYGPGRRPPHTLSPLVATGPAGDLRLVAGTMGGDAQPQILLQVAARILGAGEDPADAVAAGRFALAVAGPGPRTGFDTWSAGGRVKVVVEGHAAGGWAAGLAALGHEVEEAPAWSAGFGHAHAISVVPGGTLAGGSDPRALAGAVAAY